ncbi:MAG: hypothetical protein ABSG25_06090 [Bryobacteraceae bacterium]
MPQGSEGLDRLRDGLAAGQVAGIEHDLLFALGFAAGFIWGALTTERSPARPVLRREVRRPA